VSKQSIDQRLNCHFPSDTSDDLVSVAMLGIPVYPIAFRRHSTLIPTASGSRFPEHSIRPFRSFDQRFPLVRAAGWLRQERAVMVAPMRRLSMRKIQKFFGSTASSAVRTANRGRVQRVRSHRSATTYARVRAGLAGSSAVHLSEAEVEAKLFGTSAAAARTCAARSTFLGFISELRRHG